MGLPVELFDFRFGRTKVATFSSSCTPGEWFWFGTVDFTPPYKPTPGKITGEPIVIVSPRSPGYDPAHPERPAAVPVVVKVSLEGFDLAARNADCQPGETEFDWMALLAREPGTKPTPMPAVVQPGITTTRHFQADCTSGDWQFWYGIGIDTLISQDPYSFSTATDIGAAPTVSDSVFPFSGDPQPLDVRHAPVIGLTYDTAGGLVLHARNVGFEGEAACMYVLAHDTAKFKPGLYVDTRQLDNDYYKPKDDWDGGQWNTRDVYFSDPFIAPPVVLLTATGFEPQGDHVCAPVGIASNVTAYGFTLAARNSDCLAGEAGFNYAAFGCPQCGTTAVRRPTPGSPPPPPA